MPLRPGNDPEIVSENIGEMLSDYKHGDGKIGNVRPRNKAHARKIAAAAAYNKARYTNSPKHKR